MTNKPNHSLTTTTLAFAVGFSSLMACGPRAIPNVPSLVVGSCIYVNGFSGREECREYLGDGWNSQLVTSDCASRSGRVTIGGACNYPTSIGRCILNGNQPNVTRIWFPGSDAGQCGGTRTGCEFFGGGVFIPNPVCGGEVSDGGASSGLPTFQPPTLECKPPLSGQDAGVGPDGGVCTWSAISGCTEPGRRYDDYGSCEQVRTQRPYWPAPAAPQRPADQRLQDPNYVQELSWVRSQVEACACVCCHSDRIAPRGPSNWYIEAPGNWVDSFGGSGLALGAGWVDSTALGAYPPENNNGFSRTLSGIPSTDPARMQRFFEGELINRGLTRQTFANVRPFGGPIYDQLIYQPTACQNNEGVHSDGTVRWSGGPARYIYILETGSANPGVPPNLDLPQGTVWRIDVAHTGTPIGDGFMYGSVPTGASQNFPREQQSPAALVSGRQYYIYVLADVGIPITRCLFTKN